jgi:hypothetical protein
MDNVLYKIKCDHCNTTTDVTRESIEIMVSKTKCAVCNCGIQKIKTEEPGAEE